MGDKAFENSFIQSLTIPSQLESFGKDWCLNAQSLKNINLSKDNKHFKYLDDTQKIIIGKSSPECEEFDSIVFSCRDIEKVTIPSTIKEILSSSFNCCRNLKTVEFERNSKLEIIQKNAFTKIANLETIEIPLSVKILEDGWMNSTYTDIDEKNVSTIRKTHVSLMKGNSNFKSINDKMILGKSDLNSNEFDVLVYANDNNKAVVFSSQIKYINSYSFIHCENLEIIRFILNSKLISINESAFASSSIKEIIIPSSCQKLEKYAFALNDLKVLKFPSDSKVKSLPERLLFKAVCSEINFPKSIEKLEPGWCEDCKLSKVIISPENHNFSYLNKEHKIIMSKSDSKSDIFDVIEFACRDIKEVLIPSSVTCIKSCAFNRCKILETVDFAKDSQLKTIGEKAFSLAPITKIDIPSSVVEVSRFCFINSTELQKINIPKDSQLKNADGISNVDRLFKKFIIPPKLTRFPFFNSSQIEITISPENQHFKYLDEDKKIIIGKNDREKSDDFDTIYYASKDIQSAFIPSTIKYISSFAFSMCTHLENIELEKNSQLTIIDQYAFQKTGIKEIKIPSNVIFIGNKCFSSLNLKKIEFEPNSKLIGFKDFGIDSVEYISLPVNFKKIKFYSPKLKNVYLPPENKNFSYSDESHKMILGKSKRNENEEIFDSIDFVCRDCKEITIPSYITTISSFSFAFINMKRIFIPKKVTTIQCAAFFLCKNLTSIEFEDDSNLDYLGYRSFQDTNIRGIIFPKKYKSFNSEAFKGCKKMVSIEFLSDEINLNSLNDLYVSCISLPNAHKIQISKKLYRIKCKKIFTLPNTIIKLDNIR